MLETRVRAGCWRVAVAMCALGAAAACAQDTREVKEPVVPAACVRLEARLAGKGTSIAEKDEGKLDTERIQEGLDGCAAGQAVELGVGAGKGAGMDAFLSGPLELREGVTLLLDKGVTLFASRRASDFDVTPGSCGILMKAKGRGCRSFVTIRAKNAAIMGDGVIDGRGGARLLDKGYSWWALAVKAEPGNVPYSDPRLIDAAGADGFVLYRITLHNAPNFHVGVSGTNGFTAWGVHIKTPSYVQAAGDARPRNTDGINPGSSTNITIAHSWIDNGDDNVAIKTGVTRMSVIDNHFYSGHGMSIGSETYTGDSFIFVDGLTEDHTTSGIRIKSNVTRGGSVHDLIYRNICMRDVSVPIAISPYYNDGTVDPFDDPGFKGNRIPDYRGITIVHVRAETVGDVLIAGYDEAHRTQVNLVDVGVRDITAERMHFRFADIGDGGTNLPLEQAAEGTTAKIGPAPTMVVRSNFSCVGKFVAMQ